MTLAEPRRRLDTAREAGGLVASLAVSGLTVTYATGQTALADASFELGPGTIAGLVGVNGSGKSTLFKAIMGFVAPSAGEVRIAGLPPRVSIPELIIKPTVHPYM